MRKSIKPLEAVVNAHKDINEILDDLIHTLKDISPPLAKMKSGNPVLTTDKTRLISWFKKGKTVDQMVNRFPQYTTRQLSAIKAHVTMGTY